MPAISPAVADRLAEIHRLAFATLGMRSWTAAEFSELLNSSHCTLFTYVNDMTSPEVINSFAVVRQVLDEAELLTIAVLPELWGRKLGTRLLAKVEQELVKTGTTRLILEVASTNRHARCIYDVAGYIVIGRRSRYYQLASGPDDALILAKTFP